MPINHYICTCVTLRLALTESRVKHVVQYESTNGQYSEHTNMNIRSPASRNVSRPLKRLGERVDDVCVVLLCACMCVRGLKGNILGVTCEHTALKHLLDCSNQAQVIIGQVIIGFRCRSMCVRRQNGRRRK